MLRRAEYGILYQPPPNVSNDNQDIRAVNSYSQLKHLVSEILERDNL
jgi:hypothetical protein